MGHEKMFVLKQYINGREIVLSEYEDEDVARAILYEARRRFQSSSLSVSYEQAYKTSISWKQWLAIGTLSLFLVCLRFFFGTWSWESAALSGFCNFAIFAIWAQIHNYNTKLKIHDITDVEKLRVRGDDGKPIIEPIPEFNHGLFLVSSLKQCVDGKAVTLSEYFEPEDARAVLLETRRQYFGKHFFVELEYMPDLKHQIAFFGPLVLCGIIGIVLGWIYDFGVIAGLCGGELLGVLLSFALNSVVSRKMPREIFDVDELEVQ